MTQNVRGEADFTKPLAMQAARPTWYTDCGASGDVTLPGVLSLGVMVEPIKDLTLEFDLVRTFWSSYEKLTFNYERDLVPPTGVTSSTTTKNWHDVWRYQVGLEYGPTDWLDLRCGYVYDQSPIPDEHADYLLPTNDRELYNLGLGFKHDNWTADLSYTYLLMHQRDTNARAGEGVYNTHFENGRTHILGLTLGYRF